MNFQNSMGPGKLKCDTPSDHPRIGLPMNETKFKKINRNKQNFEPFLKI